MSLWKVADAQTQALMVDYYQRLLKGEGRSAALREAQKAMIANPATQHPYYWAAFVPLGNWTPLAAKGSAQPEYLRRTIGRPAPIETYWGLLS